MDQKIGGDGPKESDGPETGDLGEYNCEAMLIS